MTDPPSTFPKKQISSSLLTILLVLASVSSCTQLKPYRTRMPEVSQDNSRKYFKCAVDPRAQEQDGARKRCLCKDPASADQAIQHRHYSAQFRNDKRDKGDYYLSFVEFDDQGSFAERDQMTELFKLLDKLEAENTETLIYVYAHGWKHNASFGDDNVVYFSRMLERLDLAERKLYDSERKVVGVYLGWRGLPYKAGVLTNLSFWNRKGVAARVGQGGVLELLTGLNKYRNGRRSASRNEGGKSEIKKTQLMITGHSFGGLVIYSALSQALMERATPRPGASGARNSNVKSFGDFVMLVNPAFEGSMYEPLYQIAKHQNYNKEQQPVMMIVTSEADSATKVAFPMGRTVSTLFKSTSSREQAKSLRTAVGHDERYQTHNLRFVAPKSVAPKPMDKKARAYPLLQATAKWDQNSLLEYLFNMVDDSLVDGRAYGEGVNLTPDSFADYDPRYPFLVVKTDKQIIADHNSIYSERFINFAQLFYTRHILHGKPLPGKKKTTKKKTTQKSPITIKPEIRQNPQE